MLKLSRISLKWRLIFAFLAVSVTPVLVSSYMAASAIQSVFQRNLDQWISEAALFLLNEISESEAEAAKAATTVATTLNQGSFDDVQAGEAARHFADLLSSVGYDFVKLYDDAGKVVFASPGIDLDLPKIEHRHDWVRAARINDRPGLLVGATRSFEAQGHRYSIVVADAVNEALFGAANQHASLDVRVYPLVDGQPVYASDQEGHKEPIPVTPAILDKLANTLDGMTLSKNRRITTAFAGVYGADRKLLGIFAVRLSGATAVFEELGHWGFFVGLAMIAGVLALVVAILVSSRITRPLRALTRGVRAVASGNYRARVRETGGRELAELGGRFNAMAEQLDRLKSMEAEMRKKQQFAAFGEAAAVIAHEIRNPLGIIKTSSQVVRMKSRLAPAEDRMIGFVLEEVRRIDNLIQDILDYVRPRDMERETLDLRDVLAHVAEAARPALAERGIKDDVVACAAPLSMLGDRDRLHQAFLNLVLNAMDAMPDGGELRIVEECDAGMAKISVADRGIGMPEHVRLRAFDPFFTTKTRGSGLGLAKVQAIIGDHGGSIICESKLGEGTTFTICLSVLQNQGQLHAPMHPAG